ncbi:hypothetical protein [Azorhizobium doebereinerae]|uniref:hypothetical protein n=1 Tax=Azorhizobium doebereinerae TaxID=281091 RepID=UPI00040EFDE0|nr:hypothetical protein [Azorhizobium doebereinerae]
MSDVPNEGKVPAPSHPEELTADWELKLGKLNIHARARCTPAGIVTAGIAATAILLAVRALIRARR